MKRSPIKVSDLNPINAKKARLFLKDTLADKMLIVAYRKGENTLHYWTGGFCWHDKMALARELLDEAMMEMIEDV